MSLEIDERVAREVMGLRFLTYEAMLAIAEVEWETQPHCRHFHAGFTCHSKADRTFSMDVKPYSTDIAAAWEVVEKITDTDPLGGGDCMVRIDYQTGAQCVVQIYYPGPPPKRFEIKREATADTAPMAICLAALEAVSDE